MTFILAILAVPFLAATGIYNPQVMNHGRCIAEPGTFDALYCPDPRHLPIICTGKKYVRHEGPAMAPR